MNLRDQRGKFINATNTIAALVFAVIGCTAMIACSTVIKSTDKGPGMSALGSEEAAGGKIIEKFDLSGDKKADLWKVLQVVPALKEGDKEERILVQKKMDLNFDGKVDVIQFMRKDGEIYREEMDLDFDGAIDAVAFYKKGILVRRELDLTFDGRADVIKYYEDGKLVRKERDASRNGRIDVWEYYESGRIVRIGRDKDGDGKPEYFDEAPEQDPEIPDNKPNTES
ncbi:MAG TPA: hypothetical protein EYN66_16550 [Myxococcales bacterium]|nr:hypothetical protein [Myxococcales bacterium]